MDLQAFIARRVVTTEGVRPAAILVDGERIQAVVSADQAPDQYKIHDFGDAAILPGLVDSHVHINDPGRAEWEGFETATRAAAAGGYTMLVDMPLNCLPATTTVAGLQAKRAAAGGKCRVDWAAWGGVVHDNQSDIEALAAAGVPGFKCFLIDPGIDGFTHGFGATVAIGSARMLPGLAFRCWYMRNSRARLIERPPRWQMQIGASTRPTCSRARMRRNWLPSA